MVVGEGLVGFEGASGGDDEESGGSDPLGLSPEDEDDAGGVEESEEEPLDSPLEASSSRTGCCPDFGE